MKTFLPLFVGLLGWFLVAAMVLSTFVGSARAPEREKKPTPTMKVAPRLAAAEGAT